MKVFLISHIADCDGVTPVILTDLAFEDYDYELLDVKDVDPFMTEKLDTNFFDDYDKVFMTDLCVGEEVAERINNSDFKNKFIVLDHHYGNMELNRYDFINEIEEANGIKESGTSLYYQYLLKNYPNNDLMHESVAYMVTLVRLADTWEWKKYGVEEARDLTGLLAFYGNEKFINNYTVFLRKNREFYFTEAEKLLIETDKKRKHDYIENLKDKVIFKDIAGMHVCIVFAELYRSEVGNELCEYYPEADLTMVINLNRTFSFRAVKESVNVSDFATIFGGKGHPLAAGAPLPENFKEKIIDLLLEGIECK